MPVATIFNTADVTWDCSRRIDIEICGLKQALGRLGDNLLAVTDKPALATGSSETARDQEASSCCIVHSPFTIDTGQKEVYLPVDKH